MKCKLGFSQTSDGQLLVISELLGPSKEHAGLSVTKFPDEGLFLSHMVLAELEPETTTSIISNVLLVIAGRPEQAGWTCLELREHQFYSMGLSLPVKSSPKGLVPGTPLPDGDQIRDVLMQAPMPVAMLVGPQHEFAFINPAYVRLIGRKCSESVLGRPVREALPELEGQGFFRLLSQVFKTGIPYIGREVPALLRNEENDRTEEFFFDFVYYPARDRVGQIYGVLCLATDVSERVLERQVSEARELQMYRQWAELEAIYKGAPVGMALVDAREYRVLRINEANADMLGVSARELIGKSFFEVLPGTRALRTLYERVVSGEEIRYVQLNVMTGNAGAPVRKLLVSFSPVLDACGMVEAIASTTIDYSEVLLFKAEIVLELDLALSGVHVMAALL